MKNEKQYFKRLLKNSGIDTQEIKELTDYVTHNVNRQDKSKAYESMTYAFIYSGLTSNVDLIKIAKEWSK